MRVLYNHTIMGSKTDNHKITRNFLDGQPWSDQLLLLYIILSINTNSFLVNLLEIRIWNSFHFLFIALRKSEYNLVPKLISTHILVLLEKFSAASKFNTYIKAETTMLRATSSGTNLLTPGRKAVQNNSQ